MNVWEKSRIRKEHSYVHDFLHDHAIRELLGASMLFQTQFMCSAKPKIPRYNIHDGLSNPKGRGRTGAWGGGAAEERGTTYD